MGKLIIAEDRFDESHFCRYHSINLLKIAKFDWHPILHHNNLNTKEDLVRSIRQFSGLYIDFGWAFETPDDIELIFNDFLDNYYKSKYDFGDIFTDHRCSWFGFEPLWPINTSYLDDMSLEELNTYQEQLVDYQIDVITHVQNHPLIFKYFLTRDSEFRFDYLKSKRENIDELTNGFWEYVTASMEISRFPYVFKDILEKEIGCHFIDHSSIYHELLLVLKLKGQID